MMQFGRHLEAAVLSPSVSARTGYGLSVRLRIAAFEECSKQKVPDSESSCISVAHTRLELSRLDWREQGGDSYL